MPADPSYLLKLWNRGVDVGVGVITSALSAGTVAVIAIVFWNWKKARDLRFEADKQRQNKRITDEFAEQERRRTVSAYHARLTEERRNWALKMAEAPDFPQIQDNWSSYWYWLITNSLDHLPGNRAIPREHPEVKWPTHGSLAPLKQKLSELIQRTELPPRPDVADPR